MMLEYSRDALSGPMAALAEVLDSVTAGTFDPDATRSGYKFAKLGARAIMAQGQPASKESTGNEEHHALSPFDDAEDAKATEDDYCLLSVDSEPEASGGPHKIAPPVRRCYDEASAYDEWNDESFIYIGPKSTTRDLPESSLLLGLKRPKSDCVGFLEDYELAARRTLAVEEIRALAGKQLVCLCPLELKCHGDVLIKLFHEVTTSVPSTPVVDSPRSSSSDDELSDESTSTDLSDREKAAHVEASHEKVADELCEAAGEDDIAEELPEGGLWVHAKRGTWHIGSTDDEDKFMCSRARIFRGKCAYVRMGAWPMRTTAWCTPCKQALDRLHQSPLPGTAVELPVGAEVSDLSSSSSDE